jgi:hypothetical protein
VENNSEITKIFNRHIGKILEACDQCNLSPIIKQGIKSQLWLCHDDIQNKVRELVKYETKTE